MREVVKALASPARLQIVGVLAKSAANAVTVASELGIPFREAFNHLCYLEYIGVVRALPAEKKQDALYQLQPGGMEKLAASLPEYEETPPYAPDPGLDEKSRKVLANFLNADGSIKQLPAQPSKLRIILNYLLKAFTPGQDYTEKEVNTIIRRYHEDTAGLRRDLIDAGLMQRESDGSRYWRPA
jgi:hypothetical protein